jgi:hypothetical protein
MCYLEGVSTRRVEDIAQAMGIELVSHLLLPWSGWRSHACTPQVISHIGTARLHTRIMLDVGPRTR